VARYLRIDLPDVQRLVDAEELHAIEVLPGVVRVDPTDLRRFVETRRRSFRPTFATRGGDAA